MSYDFRYVTRKEAVEVKKVLISLINDVQDEVRDNFTFSYHFIGSSARNMITEDEKSNIGFDFDVNIEVNDPDENYEPNEIKHILMQAFNDVIRQNKLGYGNCEDSTRVFTIKFIDHENSRIVHSCDFAIVYNCSNGRQQYIRFNKSQTSYYWEYQPDGYNLDDKISAIKSKGFWDDVLELYISKKNNNANPDKKSRSLFAETIKEVYEQHF